MTVVPLSATGLKTLNITAPRSSPLRVFGLSTLTALSSLYLSAVQPSNDQLPGNIPELTLADFDLVTNVFMDAKILLNKFEGQLHTLSLGASAFKAFTGNMAQLSAVSCLEHLTHLGLSVSEVRATTPAVTQACFLGLQTLNLRICNPILPCWDFSLCPKLEVLHLSLALLLHSHPTVDLRRLTGMRVKRLILQVECEPNVHILVNVAGWELESASVMLSQTDGPVPHCRDSMVGRELLGALYLEVPQDKVAG